MLLFIFAFALILRLWGLSAESLWGDEFFTLYASDHTLAEILSDNAKDVHPPLYYLGLHLWRTIGNDSQGWVRAFSLFWSLLFVGAIFLLARDAAGSTAGCLAALLAAANPLSIYYAQEARNYAQLATILTFGSWLLWRWIMLPSDASPRKQILYPVLYALSAWAAIYTHFIAVFVLLAQGFFAVAAFILQRRFRCLAACIVIGVLTALSFVPWVLYSISLRGQLHTERNLGWIHIPPFSDYFAFLCNEFFWGIYWGHSNSVDPTRWNRWLYLSILLPVVMFGLLSVRLWRNRNHRTEIIAHTFSIFMLLVPVLLVGLSACFYYPLYVRHRFYLVVLPYFLVLTSAACLVVPKRALTAIAVVFFLIPMLIGTTLQRITDQKFDLRAVARAWPKDETPAAMVFFPSYDAPAYGYYLRKDFKSSTWEELSARFPELTGKEIWVIKPAWEHFQTQPYAIGYHSWLLGLGSSRVIPLFPGIYIQAIRVGSHTVPEEFRDRFDRWYPPVETPGEISGFEIPELFHILEFDPDGKPFRWALPETRIALYHVAPGDRITLNLGLQPFRPEGVERFLEISTARLKEATPPDLGEVTMVVRESDPVPGTREFSFEAPQGEGTLLVMIRTHTINPFKAGVRKDDRDLGVAFHWVGIKSVAAPAPNQ
ncbi:MAG: glycosyltransferase family 39 protein [bacterium]